MKAPKKQNESLAVADFKAFRMQLNKAAAEDAWTHYEGFLQDGFAYFDKNPVLKLDDLAEARAELARTLKQNRAAIRNRPVPEGQDKSDQIDAQNARYKAKYTRKTAQEAATNRAIHSDPYHIRPEEKSPEYQASDPKTAAEVKAAEEEKARSESELRQQLADARAAMWKTLGKPEPAPDYFNDAANIPESVRLEAARHQMRKALRIQRNPYAKSS
jgi:hypothetical protein